MNQDKKILIVGLGNPGTQYQKTHHNAGFLCIDQLSYALNIEINLKKFNGLFGKGNFGQWTVYMLKPQTFMNLSGQSVAPAAQFYDLKPEQILVIHDELDLKVGDVRFKAGGGHGGHNGLKSIISSLGNNKDFYRLRLGIGRPERGDVINYVLSPFSALDSAIFNDVLNTAIDAIKLFLDKGPEASMNFCNGLYRAQRRAEVKDE